MHSLHDVQWSEYKVDELQVSKQFRNVIEGSAMLQYRLELGRQGLLESKGSPENSPFLSMSAKTKRQALRDLHESWMNLRPRETTFISGSDPTWDSFFQIAGGVWAQGYEGSEISLQFTQTPGHIRFGTLPSISRNFDLQYSNFHNDDFEKNCAFAMDPSQGLFVFVQRPMNL